MSPGGTLFKVDVKGLAKPNYWIIRRRELIPNLFYILAYVPHGNPNEFFILSHQQVIQEQFDEIETMKLRKPEIGHDYPVQGVKWAAAKNYNKWGVLPA